MAGRGASATRLGARIGFDEGLAHLIEAGADMFLMPSLFEPCGLNQMYSLRYGTVPIVRCVGGLADTVADYWPGRPMRPDSCSASTRRRRCSTRSGAPWRRFRGQQSAWHALQVNGMRQDLSWDRSAREYVKIYEDAAYQGENLMAAENVQTFTDGNFDQSVLQSGQPVLVDFWAEWCGPCKRLGPTIDQLASEYAGKVTIGKLNVDDNPNTAIKFQIRGIPAVLLFKGGQIVESVIGLAPKDDFKKAIDKHI